MKVGTICKLKVDCLSNKAGTLGVVFYDYGNGSQVIFENGNYDGFSTSGKLPGETGIIEEAHFLEEVGFEPSLSSYQFKNVVQVLEDYRKGLFNIAWSEKWQGEYDPFKNKAERNEIVGELRKLAKKLHDQTILIPTTEEPQMIRPGRHSAEKLLYFIADMLEK